MKLPRTIDEVENFVASLRNEWPLLELDFSESIQRTPFPLEEMARAQALISYFRMGIDHDKALNFKVASAPDAFELMGSSLMGLIVIALGRTAYSREEQTKLRNIRNSYFEQLKNWPDLAQIDSSFIVCDDGYSKGLPAPLFDQLGNLRSDTYFQNFVPTLVNSVVKKDELKGAIVGQSSLLTTLIYELIKNTQDHALFDSSGSGIANSVRIVFARFYEIDALDAQLDVGGEAPLEPHVAYVRSLKQRQTRNMRDESKKKFRGILEFSVLDSGPGFVESRLKRKVDSSEDIDVEYKAVLDCLRAGHSTARNPNRGLGLTDVLRALRSLNGFIRIRTNRVSLYRDYNLLQPNIGKPVDESLLDWKRGFATRPSSLAAINGANVSVLVPVEV